MMRGDDPDFPLKPNRLPPPFLDPSDFPPIEDYPPPTTHEQVMFLAWLVRMRRDEDHRGKYRDSEPYCDEYDPPSHRVWD